MRLPLDSTPSIGSASVIAMLDDPRVLWVYPESCIWRNIEPIKPEVPLTVVIPVHDSAHLTEALNSLRYQRYSQWSVLVVCSNPEESVLVFDIVKKMKAHLPKVEVFTVAKLGWLSDALNAAAHSVRTEYWCRLDPDDLLHPMALQTVSQAIQKDEAEYYYTCRFSVTDKLYVRPEVAGHSINNPNRVWSGQDFPYSHLITYRNSAVAQVGGFRTYDKFPNDAEWIMAYSMLAAGLRLQYINAALYYKTSRDKSASHEAGIGPAGYRKSLILQHWPDRYQNDYGEV